ncbi:hypothetical protein Gotur_024046 [Gossypium turneri]
MSCETVQSKPESKERQRLSLVSHQRGFHPRKRAKPSVMNQEDSVRVKLECG